MKRILLTALLLGGLYCSNAQDVHFSQFYENTSLRNPALVGIMGGDYKAGAIYRSQWSTLAVPFTTALASYETRICVNKETRDYLNFGLTGLSYKAGKAGFSTSSVYATINFSKSLEDEYSTYLSIGLTGAYLQRSFDMSKMTFASQFQGGGFSANNPTNEQFRTTTATGYDIGAGASLTGQVGKKKRSKYYLGLGAYNIVPFTEAYIMNSPYLRKSVRWTGNLGFTTPINQVMNFIVHANYQMQGQYNETQLGALIAFKNKADADNTTFIFSTGCFYRLRDAVIPTVKMEYRNWAINFSYDYGNIGRFGNVDFGSYEISLFVKGFYKQQKEYAGLKCPAFDDILITN